MQTCAVLTLPIVGGVCGLRGYTWAWKMSKAWKPNESDETRTTTDFAH